MKTKALLTLATASVLSWLTVTCVAGTYKRITIDGNFADWAGVPVAYSQAPDTTSSIAYTNVFLANDENYLYIRFAIATADNPFTSIENILFDTDTNILTGYHVASYIGSEMLVQGGAGYDQRAGQWNGGTVSGLDWQAAPPPPATEFEARISRTATFTSDGTSVFTNDTIAIILESEDSSYTPHEYVPPIAGGLVYTFAEPPSALTSNVPLLTLTGAAWAANAAGSDLGAAWLDPAYDDTQAGWVSGPGLFGYTSAPGLYPPIHTTLPAGPNTYYFRAHFNWNNLPDNVAFVVTNYLSDGAVFYVNGVEVNRLRMPAGTISYSTPATGTNPSPGQPEIFGISGAPLVVGDNLFEVETHQPPGSAADMVFGLSLTAAAQYPVVIVDPSQPADRTVNAGDATQFTASILGSGPLSYQWLFDGAPIPSATNAIYTIPEVIYTNAGSYALEASNPFSTNTTRAAVLTVTNTPVALGDPSQPADVVAVEGRAVTLTSAATGSPPLAYQWYFDGVPIAGATANAYTLATAWPTNAGAYYVSISNRANSTNSRAATLTVLRDTLPPTITNIAASSSSLTVQFSEALDPATATNPANYSVSPGASVTGAALNPADASQVILTTSALDLGAVYTLQVAGVKDLFGNASVTAGSFTRGITIDGDFSDWAGLTPIYSGPSGADGAADFEDIYVFNDATHYYFRVTLWHDIPPAAGEFPLYANLYFDTDNNVNTGHLPGTIGAELLAQSGAGYQEKNGGFNEGGINGLDWACLPASPNLDFEFSFSQLATYASDGLPVFTTNVLNFHFEGQTTSWAAVNEAPPSGVLSYTNVSVTVPPLPLSKLAASPLPGPRVAITWEGAGSLQAIDSLKGGSWTTLPNAVSPYVIPASATQQWFRLAQ